MKKISFLSTVSVITLLSIPPALADFGFFPSYEEKSVNSDVNTGTFTPNTIGIQKTGAEYLGPPVPVVLEPALTPGSGDEFLGPPVQAPNEDEIPTVKKPGAEYLGPPIRVPVEPVPPTIRKPPAQYLGPPIRVRPGDDAAIGPPPSMPVDDGGRLRRDYVGIDPPPSEVVPYNPGGVSIPGPDPIEDPYFPPNPTE